MKKKPHPKRRNMKEQALVISFHHRLALSGAQKDKGSGAAAYLSYR